MNIQIDTSAPDRLEELVLHVANMSENDKYFLSTKLNKLVWAADFEAFCSTGTTISRASYQKEKHGPVPRAMPIILSKLQEKGKLRIDSVNLSAQYSGNRPVALKKANLSAFSAGEIAMIDKVIAENFSKTGTRMSDETHKRLAYKSAELGESIPFAAWLVYAPETSPEHERIAKDIERELRDGQTA